MDAGDVGTTSRIAADGEIVWFWRSNAGAKSRRRHPARRRWQPSMVTGEITYKPLKPLRRECRWRIQSVVATLEIWRLR
jgi:hypothetical protein